MSETMGTTEMGTKPVAEHAWLQNLVGEWKVETEFMMGPDGATQKSEGTESVRSLGGLWAVGEGRGTMPDGASMTMVTTLGYDSRSRSTEAAGSPRCRPISGNT